MIDPTLARLAAGLRYLIFDIDETEREDFYNTPKFNISIFPNSRTWRVRLFLAGRRCVVGTTDDGPTAARYADAARLFFWPYRARNAHSPTEADMNYSLEQAESDLANVDGLQAMLSGIVSHLQLELPDLEKPRKEDRRTVRSDVNARFETQERLICALSELVITQFHIAEKQRTEIQEQLRIADKQHVEMRDALRRIEKFLIPLRPNRAYYTDADGVEHEVNDDGTPLEHTPCLDSMLTYRRNDDGTLERLDYTPSIDNTPGRGDDDIGIQ